jgi:predicted acylesterase/phospholipase RssA
MKTQEVAICLSGGGFRAAAFHLGTLSYLSHLRMADGRTFLSMVNTMSTISGGTITGLWYVAGLCKGLDDDQSFKALYQKLQSVDIPTVALESFVRNQKDVHSFIKLITDVYDELFFKNETFGLILDNMDKIHVHHFSANGTDFSYALPFRYQATKAIDNAKEEYKYGLVGNNYNMIPRDIARQIRLSEILATSSCFPGGFEPLVFPTDFKLSSNEKNSEYVKSIQPIGLMDGGIVDNQGLEYVEHAEKQLECNDPEAKFRNTIDLIIASDVASPYMEAYKANSFSGMKNVSINALMHNFYIAAILMIAADIASLGYIGTFWTGVLTTLSFFSLVAAILVHILRHKVDGMLKKSPVGKCKKSIRKLTVNTVINLLTNRATSLMMLTNTVFMKHIRRLSYGKMYDNKRWTNRLIMNAIYELRPGESWQSRYENKRLAEWMKPSELIQQNSKKAADMGTTLWFTDEDKSNGMPEAIVAAGQYNICWNLLAYIERLEHNNLNTDETHELIIKCKDQLIEDWTKFKEDPMWLFKEKIG